MQQHIKSYLKIKSHLKNKLCCPIPSPHTPRPTSPSPASLTTQSLALLWMDPAQPLVTQSEPSDIPPAAQDTRCCLISLPGRHGGGQERASSKKGVSGRGRGGGGGKDVSCSLGSVYVPLSSSSVARPWRGPQWACRALTPLCPAT